jgi:hypothetical protein
MGAVREQALAEVDQLVDNRTLTSMSQWREVVQHPAELGMMLEGEELEGELDEGEPLWDDEDDFDDDDDDDMDDHGPGGDEGEAKAKDAVVDFVKPDVAEDPIVVADAMAAAERLGKLKRLLSEALASNVPSAAFQFDKEVRMLERGLHASGRPEDRKVNHVLRRALDDKRREEHKRVSQQREAARKRKDEVAKVKKAMAKSRAKKAKAAAEKKAWQAKLDRLPKKLCPKECGKGGAAGNKARCDALERLKMLSPPLHFSREARWPKVKAAYAAFVPTHLKIKNGEVALGHHFVKEVTQVLRELGSHYRGPSEFKKAPGNPEAFALFFKRMENTLPKSTAATKF